MKDIIDKYIQYICSNCKRTIFCKMKMVVVEIDGVKTYKCKRFKKREANSKK